MTFNPLASSSRGNAYIVEDRHSRILVECGVSYKKLQELTGFSISGLDGCLISHEHKDHSGCWEQLIKNGVPVYSSEGTAEALGSDLIRPLYNREVETVGGFNVMPFRTWHDASEPFGFLVQSRSDSDLLVFATDTVNFAHKFPGVTIAAIECNYSPDILAKSKHLPEKVRHRITNAHMSIDRACAWLAGLDKSRLRDVYLMHLSDACSDERLFKSRAEQAVGRAVRVTVCPKEKSGDGM